MNPSASTLLALALLALAAGPLLYGAARARGRLTAALDGFLFVGVGGFVLLQLVPASAALAGWAAAAAAVAAGLWLPALIGRHLPPLERPVRVVALLLALAAVGVHSCIDGLALSGRTGGGDSPLAVVLHRLPVGLALWFLLRPLYGLAPALAALGAVAAATTGGFLGFIPGGAAAPGGPAWGLFQALTAGALLHVVLRRRYPVAPGAEGSAARRWPSGLGALAALVLLGVATAAQGGPRGPGRDGGRVLHPGPGVGAGPADRLRRRRTGVRPAAPGHGGLDGARFPALPGGPGHGLRSCPCPSAPAASSPSTARSWSPGSRPRRPWPSSSPPPS